MAWVKMVRSQVRYGVPSLWEVRDAEGKLLVARGGVVENDEQLTALLAHGAMVNPDEVKAALAAAGSRVSEAPPADTRPTASLFDLWEKLFWRLERLAKGIQEDAGFAARLDELALNLVQLVERDADIGVFLSVRQDQHRFSIYGLSHAVFTAMLCFLLARRVGWPRERCLTLVKAALTMNMSMFELQGRLAAQGIAMLAEQKTTVFGHPLKSAQMLRAAGVNDEEWLAAVEQHHEWVDGSGYPKKLTQISEMARALKYADVFMAKISPRAIRSPMSAQEAARQLFKIDGGGPMAMAIVKEFGIYPPGEFVRLKSGELAVVIRRTDGANTPVAASITDKSGVPSAGVTRRETARPEYAIAGLVPDKTLLTRVSPERLFGLPG